MADETVKAERDGELLVLTLCGPRGNAIGSAMIEALAARTAEARDDDAVAAVMLRHEGKLFSPGLDLAEVVDLDRPAMERLIRGFCAMVLELYALPKPLVAAIDGHALAGGMLVALTADWRIISRRAKIGLNEVKVGVPLPYGMATIVRESVPRSHLTEVALEGRNFSGTKAVEIGMAQEMLVGDLRAHALRRLRTLAGKDATAFATTKRFLRERTIDEIREQEDAHRDLFLDGWFSPGTRERLTELRDALRRS